MKNNNQGAKFTFAGFILFLLPLTISISLGIVLFNLVMQNLNSYLYTAIFIFIYILFITFAFCFIDIVRRKLTTGRITKHITEAAQKVVKGDFSVRIAPIGKLGADEKFMGLPRLLNMF